MDTKAMLELIEALKQTDYDHIEVEQDGNRLVLSKYKPETVVQAYAPVAAAPAAVAVQEAVPAAVDKKDDDTGLEIVKSPIVGTFYSSSSPEAPAFVQVGTKVKKGDVLCIIEAMKLMNEIEAEVDGEVVEVLVGNEDPVEYGQPLFKIKA